MTRRRFRAFAPCAAIIGTVAMSPGAGCARVVTLDPALVPRRNDVAWNIRTTVPRPQTEAVQPHPTSFLRQPAIQAAMLSPRDGLGIPAMLYEVDPLIAAHRREMESQARPQHRLGVVNIAVGALVAGLGAFMLSTAAKNPDPRDPTTGDSGASSIVWGSWFAMMGVGEIIAGIVQVTHRADAGPLQRYYNETYGPQR